MEDDIEKIKDSFYSIDRDLNSLAGYLKERRDFLIRLIIQGGGAYGDLEKAYQELNTKYIQRELENLLNRLIEIKEANERQG